MNKNKESSAKNQRIQVFARCRPLNNIEKKQCSPSIVEVIPERKEIILKDKNHNREFFFDKVFDKDSEQISVYKAVVAPLIKEVLNGYNCTVFAYGQTGTGKTYTMEGGERGDSKCSWEEDPSAGIIPRSLHQLFEELTKEENVEFTVRVSFLELYNEELFDLLSLTELSRLRLFEDSSKKGSVIIQGLEEVKVDSKDEVYSILEKGSARRQTAATLLNAASSRSHTVFSVTVRVKENTIDGEELIKTGKLNLVDLAGSENVGRSGAVDKRAREAGNINQSLLTLGRVITALIEKQPHVPYRESKLTRLLQDSLGGHTKTSIIATISPALCNFDETLSTLDYATKAKSITIRPEVNQKMTKRALIREYADEIEKLRKDLVALRSKEGFYVDLENYNNMLADLTRKTEMITELTDSNSLLKDENLKNEQAFNAAKDELAKITKQLNETINKYEETASELEQKTDALNHTRKILSERTLQRDEKQFIVKVQSSTEKKLTQQAQQLLSVADETTNDVEKLHAKIARKQLVDKTNEEKLQKFRITCQQQFSELDRMVSKSESEQVGCLGEMKTGLDILESGLKSYQGQARSVLQNISSHYDSEMDHFASRLESQSDTQIQMENSLFQEIIDQKNAQLGRQNLFIKEILPRLMNDLNEANNTVVSWVSQVRQQLLQKIDSRKSAIDQRIKTQSSLLSSIQDSINLFCTEHEELLQSMHETTSQLSSRQNNLKEDVAKAFEVLVSLQKKIAEAEVDTSKLQETNVRLRSSATTLETTEKLVKEALQTVNEAHESDTEYSSELSSVIDTKKITETKESLGQVNENISTGVVKFSNEVAQMETSNLKEIKSKFDLHISTITENTQIIKSDIEKMKYNFEATVQSFQLPLQKENEELQDSTIQISNLVLKSQNRLESSTSDLKDGLKKRDVELEKFISNDIVHDVPTGTTPQRKNYIYPKVLAATSPEPRLLQRFYSQLDNSVAINLPLNSSFDESEELKCSPNFANSGSSDSVSSTVDDADSYASSVSDAGGEEKENQRHKKKTSKLPKKLPSSSKLFKNTDFIRPATPTKKKPFCASTENLI